MMERFLSLPLEASQTICRVVIVVFAVLQAVQLLLTQLDVHAVVGVGEAHNQRVVGAKVAELHRAAETIETGIAGGGIVQISQACSVARVVTLGYPSRSNVVVVGYRLRFSPVADGIQPVQFIVRGFDHASIGIYQRAS